MHIIHYIRMNLLDILQLQKPNDTDMKNKNPVTYCSES